VRLDDSSISDETELLRALPAEGWWTLDNGKPRPSSLAFYDGHSGETSCHRDTPGRRIRYALRYPAKPAAKFTAAQARSSGFSLTIDPDGDPEHSPEHILLTFNQEAPTRKVYQRACKQLALVSQFLSADTLALGMAAIDD
jgi:hypothetical protein